MGPQQQQQKQWQQQIKEQQEERHKGSVKERKTRVSAKIYGQIISNVDGCHARVEYAL